MALSQIECLKESHVNWRTNESKPEFFYSEDQRLALEVLIQGGRHAFSQFIQEQNMRPFLSDLELECLEATAEVYSPGSESASGNGNEGGGSKQAALSLQYWPDRSDCSVPDLDMGWPDCVSYRGVTRVNVYAQPPMEGQAHIKEVVRKTIAQAQKVIAVVMDLFTDMDIFTDLLDAGFKRKVAVYIILEATGVPHFLNMCRRAGMHKGHLKNLRVRCTRGMEFFTRSARKVFGSLGQRFMFVDGDRAVSGSYSFTWTASRLDRNLITVVTGQAVETFDKQFQDLYLVSDSVSLSNIHLEEAPEPERAPAPAPAPVLSAAVARKLINPKYSLVTSNVVETNTKTASEKNGDNKNPVAKVLKPPREKPEPPPIHPGLLNLERINMIPYLPTWPEPDPPSDVIGFINIRDSSKPMQVHLMRSELFETSQAIRFKDPFILPANPLPEKACPRPKFSKNPFFSPQVTQVLKDLQHRPQEPLDEAKQKAQCLDHASSSPALEFQVQPVVHTSSSPAKEPAAQPLDKTHSSPAQKQETQPVDQTCASLALQEEAHPPEQTLPVASPDLEHSQAQLHRFLNKPVYKAQPVDQTCSPVVHDSESIQASPQEHQNEPLREPQPSDHTPSPVAQNPENTQPQQEGSAEEENKVVWNQTSHPGHIPGKGGDVCTPVPKPRTIHLVISPNDGKDSPEVSIVAELDKESKTQTGLLNNSANQTSDPHITLTQDPEVSDALSSSISQPGKGKRESADQRYPDRDGRQNRQEVIVMEEDGWEELYPGESSDISTTSEEFFECDDFDGLEPRLYSLGNGTCDGSGKSKAVKSKPEPLQRKKHQEKVADDGQQTIVEISSEVLRNPKLVTHNSYGGKQKHQAQGRSLARTTCTDTEDWRYTSTGTKADRSDGHCRTASHAGHTVQQRHRRGSSTGQLSHKRPAVLWSRGGMTQVLLGSLQPGSSCRPALTQLVRPRTARSSGQRRPTRKHPAAQGDTQTTVGVSLAEMSNFRNLRAKTRTPSQQEQCL